MKDFNSRKPNRLKNYDYSQNGMYFVTICTNEMKCILSTVENVGEGLLTLPNLHLTKAGKIVKNSIEYANKHYNNICIEKYVIMPNHVHLLISLEKKMGGSGDPPLQDIIRRIKSYSSKQYGSSIWQRSFYDHIIRNENDYLLHIQYIDENPKKWIIGKDEYYA